MIVHDVLFRKYRRGICVKLSYFVLLINVASLLMSFPHNIQKIIMCTLMIYCRLKQLKK
jgi:hypothetical protein